MKTKELLFTQRISNRHRKLLLDFLKTTSPEMHKDDKTAIINAYERIKTTKLELTRDYVVETVEKISGIDIIGQNTKQRKIFYLRCVVYALLDRYFPNSSLQWKGDTFNQDHSTVIHALKQWKEEMLNQKCYKEYVSLYLKCEFYINTLLSKVTNNIKIVEEFNQTNKDQKLKEAIDILIKYTLELTPELSNSWNYRH